MIEILNNSIYILINLLIKSTVVNLFVIDQFALNLNLKYVFSLL
jgi:hypothetical protein